MPKSKSKSRSTTRNKDNDDDDDKKKKKKKEEPTKVQLPSSCLLLLNDGDFSYEEKKRNKKNNNTKVQILYKDSILVASNFFTLNECNEWIEWVEQASRLEYIHHKATSYMAYRECWRYQVNDIIMAKRLYERMKQMGLLQQVERQLKVSSSSSNNTLVACNPNIRLYKYEVGMAFGKHIDESNIINDGVTQVTVLIYLSTVEKGGSTRFWPPKTNNNNNNKNDSVIQSPAIAGKILFHVHGKACLEHDAEPVGGKGQAKYVLRTDLVYG